MAITKEEKKQIIESLRNDLSSQKAVVFCGFKGLTGEDALLIRQELRKIGAKIFVTKKTLAKIAFKEENIDFDPLSLEGEVGFVFGFEDGLSAIKTAHRFAKDEKISLLGGVFENSVMSAEEIMQIATLPSKEELLAKLIGTMSAPIGGFLSVLQGNIKGLLCVLDGISLAKKE